MKTTYRRFIYAVFTVYLIYMILPYYWGSLYNQGTLDALTWLGHDGTLDVYGPLPYMYTIALLVSLVGLHQFKKWARSAFLYLMIASTLTIPLFGLSVLGNIDAFISSVLGIGMGMILAISYFSELDDEFK